MLPKMWSAQSYGLIYEDYDIEFTSFSGFSQLWVSGSTPGLIEGRGKVVLDTFGEIKALIEGKA
jgi:hypothetical protein